MLTFYTSGHQCSASSLFCCDLCRYLLLQITNAAWQLSAYTCCIVSHIWFSQESAIGPADDRIFFNYYQQKQSPSSDSLNSSSSSKQAGAKAQEKVMILVL